MNGAWKNMSHRSLTTLTTPLGLHRVLYKLKDNDFDNLFSDDEDVWIPIKYHRRRDFQDSILNNYKYNCQGLRI